MRAFVSVLAFALGSAAAAGGESAYRLQLNSSLHEGKLTLAPSVEAPAGARLRYLVTSAREGKAGRSSTSQGGGALVGADGQARLSTLSFSVAPQDRYTVTVKVFEGEKLVAEQSLQVEQ